MSEITLIHIGDLHGHLLPRPNLRSGAAARSEGGLARMAALIDRIRAERPDSLLVNTGDTIQGGAEALFTRGRALVDAVDRLGVDLYAPGNWDYLYGKERFLELFGEGTGPRGVGHRWGALAANAYHDGSDSLLLPPRRVLEVGGLRVGVVGLSSERAINALGPWVTRGIRFTADAAEIPAHVRALREQERVDLVVLISEFGLAKNILIAERNPGIDVVLSSDMHEETHEPVVTSTGALVSEAGQDGTRVAQLDLRVEAGRIADWSYRLHAVDDSVPEDPAMAAAIREVREPFVAGPGFLPHTDPMSGARLKRPIDQVVGRTTIALHRSEPSHPEAAPDARAAVVSGTSHDFLSAALRHAAGADIGHMRGFRYGTHIAPGDIRLEDLFHLMPVGAQLARGLVTGAQVLQQLQAGANGALDPDPFRWTGGWLHAHAGLRYALDPGAAAGSKVSRVEVRRAGGEEWTPLEPDAAYSVAGYWFAEAPQQVGGLACTDIEVLRTADGRPRDVTEHVVDVLREHPVEPEPERIALQAPLPPRTGPNAEIQPLRGGASAR